MVRFRILIFLLLSGIPVAQSAQAGFFEVTLGFSYSRSNYAADNYTWTRRYGGSVGYNFTDRTSIEWDFQDIVERTKLSTQDTTFHDQVYALNWVQSYTPKGSVIQPYTKLGLALLNRDASGNIALTQLDEESAVLGLGFRIYLSNRFAIRIEGTTYLEKLQLKTWEDNIAITFGTSVFF
ncbi:porin family protein [bacterium]|jgi:hypothetical protein|nr:porin family protein [bacterium]